MTFLVVLLLLALQRYSRHPLFLQLDLLWSRWCVQVEHSSREMSWLRLLALLLPVLPIAWLEWALRPLWHGLLLLPLDLLVLLWAMGEGDPRPRLQALRSSWSRDDLEGASLYAGLGLHFSAHDSRSLIQHVQGYLLWHSYQSFFAVLFCFAIGGVPLALAYRLLAMACEQTGSGLRERVVLLRQALDWMAVRLLVLAMALTGNFLPVARILWSRLLDLTASPARLLVEGGRAAVELPPDFTGAAAVQSLDQLWDLLLRAAILWYCVWALASLLG